MERRTDWLGRWPGRPRPPARTGTDDADPHLVTTEMASVLASVLELRDTTSYVAAHAARVARLAAAIAELVEIRAGELQRLVSAARLHEIGMVGVPAELLTRPGRLSRDEIDHVRSHARLGAELVRSTHGGATARLIERQYRDHTDLHRLTGDTRDLLLSGILRVADVFEAMTVPRPYQEPVVVERVVEVLRVGSGSRFHPAAVYALLHLLRLRTTNL